jgi:hypothetical protein
VVVFRDRDIGGVAMNSVEDLDVFKLAHQLALKTYSATKASQARSSRSNRSMVRQAHHERLELPLVLSSSKDLLRSSRLADWRHLTRKNEKSDF